MGSLITVIKFSLGHTNTHILSGGSVRTKMVSSAADNGQGHTFQNSEYQYFNRIRQRPEHRYFERRKFFDNYVDSDFVLALNFRSTNMLYSVLHGQFDYEKKTTYATKILQWPLHNCGCR